MFHILIKKIKLIMPICIEGISKSPELKKRVAFSIFCPMCVYRCDWHQICFSPQGSWKVSHSHHLFLTITSAEWRGQLKSRASLIQGRSSFYWSPASWHIRQRNFYKMNASACNPPISRSGPSRTSPSSQVRKLRVTLWPLMALIIPIPNYPL